MYRTYKHWQCTLRDVSSSCFQACSWLKAWKRLKYTSWIYLLNRFPPVKGPFIFWFPLKMVFVLTVSQPCVFFWKSTSTGRYQFPNNSAQVFRLVTWVATPLYPVLAAFRHKVRVILNSLGWNTIKQTLSWCKVSQNVCVTCS